MRNRTRTNADQADEHGTDPRQSAESAFLRVLFMESGSRGRGGQDFLVLGTVLMFADTGRHNDQVLSHFVAREQLAELGDKQARLQVARQLLQLANVLDGSMANQVAN